MIINIHGALDEHAKLPEIPNPLNEGLIVDLQNLNSINSVGCRSWIQWIQALQVRDGIELINCPPSFIVQASILFGAVPKGVEIRSFYVPYYCDSCGAEELVMVELKESVTSIEDLKIDDHIICPVCSARMNIDVIKQKFLAFLAA